MNREERDCRRSGFTLVEIVVALAIIGLLMSLILPAVQSARESARRVECSAHLNELGHAISNYESLRGVLPPGRGDGSFHSPLVELLPMLEQAAYHEKLMREGVGTVYLPPDPTLLNRPIFAILRCPSDGAANGANYRFNHGPDVAVTWRGPFSVPAAPASIVTDGLSNTAAMSEALMSPAGPHPFHRADAWYSGIDPQDTLDPSNEEVIQLCTAAADHPVPAYQYVGQDWPVCGLGHAGYNHAVTPNATTLNCRLDSHPPNTIAVDHRWWSGVMKASSYHTGGVNLLMLDGAVRFASDHIDLAVWQAISTKAEGETRTNF